MIKDFLLRKYNLIKKSKELFIFWSSLTFYGLLYFNLNNRTLIIAFGLLVVWLQYRFKNLTESVFWLLVISSIFLKGKTYIFNLIPAQRLDITENSDGYNQMFILSISNLLALFLLFKWIVKKIIKRNHQEKNKKKIKNKFVFWILMIWVILSGLSAIYSLNPSLSLLFFLQGLQIPIVFIYASKIIKKKDNRFVLLFILLAQIIFEGMLAICQFVNKGPLGRSIEIEHGIVAFGGAVDEDVWRYRPVGTFLHANFLAAYLTPVLIMAFSMLYEKKKLITDNILYIIVSLGLGLVGVVVSISRSAWIALFLGIVFLVYFLEKKMKLEMKKIYQKRLLLLIVIGVMLIPWFILPRTIKSFSSFTEGGGGITRTKQIKEALLLIKQHPFLGTGLGMSVVEMFNNDSKGITFTFPSPVHNFYLLESSEKGLASLLMLIILINLAYKKTFVEKKKNIYKIGVSAAIASMLIIGLFQPFIGSFTLLFILLGFLSV